MSLWATIQGQSWTCNACHRHSRVELNVRQQTDPPGTKPKLLVVAVAPPHPEEVPREKTRASSATNDPGDVLRSFLQETLRSDWADLTARGLLLLHAVKCAIRPDMAGFQNPPIAVVDKCAPQHFATELAEIRPGVVVPLGDRAYRALVRALPPGTLQLSRPPGEALPGQAGFRVQTATQDFILLKSPFPRAAGREGARAVLARAAAVVAL
jgi:hypothetical protein